MSAPARNQPTLTDQQRDALFDELFTLQRTLEPDAFHCFCGGDADLVEAVQELREQLQHDRDDDELGA